MKIFFSNFLGQLHSIKKVQNGSLALGFLTPFILFGGYTMLFGNKADAQGIVSEIIEVDQRDITLSIKALGTVTLANEQQLRFNVLGKVDTVHVKVGDTVKRDDLIAELEKTDPLADIRQAELSVNDAYLRMKELDASRNQQILVAQNTVRDLERQLEEDYGELPSERNAVEYTIEQAKRTVLEKQKAYEKAQRDLSISIEDSITDADSLLDDILAVLSGESVIRNATRYNTFEIDFLFNDQNLRNETEWAFYNTTNAYNAFREKHGSLVDVTDTRKLQLALEDVVVLTRTIIDLADVSYEFLKTAVPQDGKYTDAELNTLKSTMNTKRTDAIALLDTLRDQQATLTLPGKSIAMQAWENAKEDLAILESQKLNKTTAADTMERSVSNLNDKLRAEQESFENTKISVDVQISQQRNLVAQRQVALEKARRGLENYELRAPFNGIVRRVDFQIGDNLLADAQEAKFVVLENPAYFVVTVLLDQVDVVHVKKDQKAVIAFDAIPNKTFEGTIDLIDTTPIQTSGVVSYEVEIVLEPSDEYTILSGMTASVEIQTASAEDAVVVPNLSIQAQGSRSFVIGEDGTRFPVETGVTDGTYTEILSGLEVGNRIRSVNVSITQSEQQEQGGRGLGGGARVPGGFGGGR